MCWNRGGQRLYNLLASLLIYQRMRPAEIIVVDTSDDPKFINVNSVITGLFAPVQWIHYPRTIDQFSKTWALNVGIRQAGSKYVAVTDADFVFGRTFVKVMMRYLREGRFVMSEAYTLPSETDLSTLFDNWQRTCANATPWKGLAEGTLQSAPRAWWYRIRGYDERFKGGTGGEDSDLWSRATRSGIGVARIAYTQAQALHQWHPQSPLKARGNPKRLYSSEAPVICRQEKWGIIDEE